MKLYTTLEAARYLGIGQISCAHAIRRGALPATKYGTVWLIREDHLEQYAATRKRGRPFKQKGNHDP